MLTRVKGVLCGGALGVREREKNKDLLSRYGRGESSEDESDAGEHREIRCKEGVTEVVGWFV